MTDRRWYVIDKHIEDRNEAGTASNALLDVLRPRVARAEVDAISDHADIYTDDAAAAEQALRALATRRRRGDPSMTVDVDLRTTEAWDPLRTYAPWSINVDLYDADGHNVATVHDCGYSITAQLTDDEAAQLRQRLGDLAPVVLLSGTRLQPREGWRELVRRLLGRS